MVFVVVARNPWCFDAMDRFIIHRNNDDGDDVILVIESSLKVNDEMVMSGDAFRQSEKKNLLRMPCSGIEYLQCNTYCFYKTHS